MKTLFSPPHQGEENSSSCFPDWMNPWLGMVFQLQPEDADASWSACRSLFVFLLGYNKEPVLVRVSSVTHSFSYGFSCFDPCHLCLSSSSAAPPESTSWRIHSQPQLCRVWLRAAESFLFCCSSAAWEVLLTWCHLKKQPNAWRISTQGGAALCCCNYGMDLKNDWIFRLQR